MSITRVGSSKQYADNWERALGGKKKVSPKKKTTRNPAAKKKVATGRKK